MTRLRLATFNILSGRSLSDLRADPRTLIDAVATLEADVIALQEVDRNQDRSMGSDQAALAAEALGTGSGSGGGGYRFVATVHGTPGRRGWVPAPGPESPGTAAYGIALVSRLPVRQWAVLRLGGMPGRYPVISPGPRPRVVWLRDEPRAAVAAVLAEPRMTLACAHLSFVPGRNAVQLRRLTRWLRTLPGPRILLGDLNLPDGLPARLTGWTPLVDAPTFPSQAPRLQLDHVLAHDLPDGATVTDAGAVRLPISDHRAAFATLHLPHPAVIM